MPTTANGLRYPSSGDASTLWTYFQNLAADVEAKFTPKFSIGRFYAYRNTNQSIASNLTVPTTIVLDTAPTPVGLTLNATTGVITVAAGYGGEYTVAAKVDISEVGSSRVFVTVFVNGFERIRGVDNINRGALSGDIVGSIVAGSISLVAGDQITLRALHTGSAATVAPGQFITWIQLQRVG